MTRAQVRQAHLCFLSRFPHGLSWRDSAKMGYYWLKEDP